MNTPIPEHPGCPPISRKTEETWKQVVDLFLSHGMPEPPFRLRDEIVTALEWAWYGQALAALTPHGEEAAAPAPSTQMTGLTDTQLLDALASNYWDLRCVDIPTGGDDADIDWIVIEHQQGKPSEVEVDRAYKDDPRLAIRRALRASDKNAARCVSCDEVLHDGDSVYYEHGEGGHIHSHCASEDPESFVDEDEVPLKAGDEIPKPFAYSVEKYEGQP